MSQNKDITHVSASAGLIDLNLRVLWQYRDLYRMYIQRDIVTYYKQTIFGPLWYIVQPIMTTLIYMFLFGNVARIPTDGVPSSLFYLAGIALWNFFNQCITSCCNVFTNNQHVFGKVYFPRLIVPFASCTSNLIRFGFQFGVFVVVLIWYLIYGGFNMTFSWNLLSLPFILLVVGFHGMAWGLFFASWSVRYRDLQYLIPFILQIGMYVTPVIYPLSFMPEKYRWLINLNPLTSLFEASRYCLLGQGTFNVYSLLFSTVFMVVCLFLSIAVFNRKARNFVDII